MAFSHPSGVTVFMFSIKVYKLYGLLETAVNGYNSDYYQC